MMLALTLGVGVLAVVVVACARVSGEACCQCPYDCPEHLTEGSAE